MHRTTVMLPEDLKSRALHRAEELGVSLGELIRQSLDALLARDRAPAEEDTLFADRAVFTGEAPSDEAQNHDRYLYGDPE